VTLPLHNVTKHCQCGATWTGFAFIPEPAVRHGRCVACLERDDAAIAPLLRPGPEHEPPVVRLSRAPRPGDADYD
jgi:hypothetical protein